MEELQHTFFVEKNRIKHKRSMKTKGGSTDDATNDVTPVKKSLIYI